MLVIEFPRFAKTELQFNYYTKHSQLAEGTCAHIGRYQEHMIICRCLCYDLFLSIILLREVYSISTHVLRKRRNLRNPIGVFYCSFNHMFSGRKSKLSDFAYTLKDSVKCM